MNGLSTGHVPFAIAPHTTHGSQRFTVARSAPLAA
jgi:hypothetical protein